MFSNQWVDKSVSTSSDMQTFYYLFSIYLTLVIEIYNEKYYVKVAFT